MTPPDIPPVDESTAEWTVEDLDRCTHGRHSIDPCADCPGGASAGNLFLFGLAVGTIDAATGISTVRIGTARDRRPILVRPDRRRRW